MAMPAIRYDDEACEAWHDHILRMKEWLVRIQRNNGSTLDCVVKGIDNAKDDGFAAFWVVPADDNGIEIEGADAVLVRCDAITEIYVY